MIDGTTLSACTDIVEVRENAPRNTRRSTNKSVLSPVCATPVAASPWPPLDTVLFTEEQVRPWLLPQVYLAATWAGYFWQPNCDFDGGIFPPLCWCRL
ncbi:MAG: hypothetical protein R2867_42965 [Caldilineaceae bacterium]